MGSDESHFNVSVGSDGQPQDSVHKPQPFLSERRAEAVWNQGPSAYQPNVLPLGQTASQVRGLKWRVFYTFKNTASPGGPEFGIKEEFVTEWGRQLFHARA